MSWLNWLPAALFVAIIAALLLAPEIHSWRVRRDIKRRIAALRLLK